MRKAAAEFVVGTITRATTDIAASNLKRIKELQQ
jgi:hypothetical protein